MAHPINLSVEKWKKLWENFRWNLAEKLVKILQKNWEKCAEYYRKNPERFIRDFSGESVAKDRVILLEKLLETHPSLSLILGEKEVRNTTKNLRELKKEVERF